MADLYLSKFNVGGQDYQLKDNDAQARLTTAEAELVRLEADKQDAIDASNKLPSAHVSWTKPEGSKLSSTDVQAAIFELEGAIEHGGTGSAVNVVKRETAADGYVATYDITQGGDPVGVPINIPKDFLVKSASIKKGSECDPAQTPADDLFIDFVINVKEGSATDAHIFLNVHQLVDAYQGDGTTIILDESSNTFSVGEIGMDQVTNLEEEIIDITTNIEAIENDITTIEGDITTIKEEVIENPLGEMAHADTATGIVAGQTFNNLKATGSASGSASFTVKTTAGTATINNTPYTPAGTVEATDGGTFSALKSATFIADASGLQISGTNAASEVTIDKENATVLGSVKTAAVLPSFAENKIGTFVAPQLTINESDSFAKAGFTAEVDGETLTLTAAATGKASVCSGWNAGSWTAGTFNPGTAAEFENATVVGSITGAEAAAQVFTGNKYNVSTTNDTALKSVEFKGTEVQNVAIASIGYEKVDATQDAATVTINGIELDVDTFTVSEKSVTVNPDA